MKDEATKLLRLVQEAEAWRDGRAGGNATLIDAAVQAIPALRAYLEALPAAAPRMIQTPVGLAEPWQVGEETDAEHEAAIAAAQPAPPDLPTFGAGTKSPAAPLPGPPRDDARQFPMLRGPSIPWALGEMIYAGYAAMGHGDQSIQRVAQRGGFSWSEVELMWRDPRARAAMTSESGE